MIRLSTITLSLALGFSTNAQTGKSMLQEMHKHNYMKWWRTLSFIQTTENYRNDSLIRVSTWYESVKLPDDIRIDLDDPQKGNFVIYKKDSTYRFQNNNLRNTTEGNNPFLFFIGGMYFMPFDSVLAQLKSRGFDINKGYETELMGEKAYVVGRNKESDTTNAFWIMEKDRWFSRIIENEKGRVIDATMKEHKDLSKGTIETYVDISINGKKVQVEKYDHVTVDPALDDFLFDPLHVREAKHWFKSQ